MSDRLAIPANVKRKVRQRCRFGCVVCGIPIYEYDHMPGFANVKRHAANELTLLCPTHHALKTRGLLSATQVVDADRDPFNGRNGATSPFELRFTGDSPEIRMGQQLFKCSDRRRPTRMSPAMIHRHAPWSFTIDTTGLMLNLEAEDSRGSSLLLIRDSELVLSTSVFDATLVGQRLTIRDEDGMIALQLLFEPPNRVCIEHCQITTNGVMVKINPNEIVFQGEGLTQLTIGGKGEIDANIGILIGDAPRGASVAIKAG